MKFKFLCPQPNHWLIIISAITFSGSVVYWFFNLSWWGQIITWIIASTTSFIIYRKQQQSKDKDPSSPIINWPSFIIITLTTWLIIYLAQQTNTQALSTPWTEVDQWFWLIYWLIALIGLLAIQNQRTINRPAMVGWWLITYSIASLIYFSAFGFDPFIHQATEKTILAQGQVLPKTPYYLGQYSLVISLHRLTGWSITIIEQWLLPLLVTIFLSWLVSDWVKKLLPNSQKNKQQISNFITWLWPLFSWPIFIATTPQNLAYFFLAITVLASFQNKPNRPLAWLAALASLTCQPLAGFIALTTVGLMQSDGLASLKRTIGQSLSFILTSLTLPLSLWWSNYQSTGHWQITWPPLGSLITWLGKQNPWPNQEHWRLNLIYSWQFWQIIVLILLIISGWIILKKYQPITQKKLQLTNLSLLIALFLSSLISFTLVINYEQYNYLTRFWWLFLIINLPALLVSLSYLAQQLLTNHQRSLTRPITIALATLLTFSLYLTYPRVDNYFNNKGLSTSSADFLAVRWIENNATSDYLVLANQQVSAAALAEYGFYPGKQARYLQTNLFYYPIPTSGPLYQYYLQMVNDYPARATIEQAAQLAGVNQAYLILNNYWYGFEKLATEAQSEADLTTSLADGQIIIFSYYFNN